LSASTHPPYFEQETAFSCAAAGLRMVAAFYGVTKSESELRPLLYSSILGTTGFELLDAARQLGFHESQKITATLGDLEDLSNRTLFPIVFVNLLPIDGKPEVHTVVFVARAQGHVLVLDPLPGAGKRSIEEAVFDLAGSLCGRQAVVVQP